MFIVRSHGPSSIDAMDDTAAYVTNHAWVRTLARPDAIDEIADQYERPVAASSEPRHWPLRSRGWRSFGLLHPSTRTPA